MHGAARWGRPVAFRRARRSRRTQKPLMVKSIFRTLEMTRNRMRARSFSSKTPLPSRPVTTFGAEPAKSVLGPDDPRASDVRLRRLVVRDEVLTGARSHPAARQ